MIELASTRIATARARLERLGVIDAKIVSTELPPDVLPDSDSCGRPCAGLR